MIVTNLIGRKVVTPWDGKVLGEIVCVFADRGELLVALDKPVIDSDGRSTVEIAELRCLTLGKPSGEGGGDDE